MMSWQKDGEDLIEDVELRETLPNQDGSFQKRSILKVSPEDLQKHEYTCVIKHSSLKEDLVLKAKQARTGGGSDGGSDVVPIGIIIGAVVGVLVLVLIVAGILVWKKKKSGFKPVPSKAGPEAESSSIDSSTDSTDSSSHFLKGGEVQRKMRKEFRNEILCRGRGGGDEELKQH